MEVLTLSLALPYLPKLVYMIQLRRVCRTIRDQVDRLIGPLARSDVPSLARLLFMIQLREIEDARRAHRLQVLQFDSDILVADASSAGKEARIFLRAIAHCLNPDELIEQQSRFRQVRMQYATALARLDSCPARELDAHLSTADREECPWKLGKILRILLRGRSRFSALVAGLSTERNGSAFGSSHGLASAYLKKIELNSFCQLPDPGVVELVRPGSYEPLPFRVQSFKENRGRLVVKFAPVQSDSDAPVELQFAYHSGEWVSSDMDAADRLPPGFSAVLHRTV